MKKPIECKVNPSAISWGAGDDGGREFTIYAYATRDNPKDMYGRAIHVKMTEADAASILGLLKSSVKAGE